MVIEEFTNSVVPDAMAFRIFQDMRGVQATYRITSNTTTTLAADLSTTDDIIYVNDVSALSTPDVEANIWGILTINGERIMYRSIDRVANTLTGLLRGTAGTGGAVATITNMPLAGRGVYSFFIGQAGSVGGTNATAGVQLTIPSTGLMVTGGSGGGGAGFDTYGSGGAATQGNSGGAKGYGFAGAGSGGGGAPARGAAATCTARCWCPGTRPRGCSGTSAGTAPARPHAP